MIEAVRLRNFKCFSELELEAGPLTILSGENSAGKSTVLQSVLLARAYHAYPSSSHRVSLNRPPLSLGTWSALRNSAAKSTEPVSVAIDHRGGKLSSYQFSAIEDSPSEVACAVLTLDDDTVPPAAARLTFVAAERVGPRSSYDLWPNGDWEVDGLGRDVPWTLETRRAEAIVVKGLHHPKAVSGGLRDQTEAWLGAITTPGVELQTKVLHDLGLLGMSFSFPLGKLRSDSQPATHVGFGLSYILPIIIAVLASHPGDLIIVENPEAHLHPRAQKRLTELLVRAASAGVQVFVETHSDHVINGARLGIAANLIDKDDVVFQHFIRSAASGLDGDVFEVKRPRADKDGFLDYWPEGFFDEWEATLRELLARRQK